MYSVTGRFLETIGGTHRAVVSALLVEGWQFGATPTGTELPILAGDVKLTATADVKATLDLTVPGDYWETVQPYSGEIWVARGVAFGDGSQELVPLGYFRIEEAQQDEAPFGPVQITGADRIVSIQQNRVLFPYQVPEGTTHRTIFERLVNGRLTPSSEINTAGYAALIGSAIPIVWTGYDPDRATVTGGQVVEDSTYDFLAKLADSKACVLRFDELGQLQVEQRDRDPDAAPVYTIQPGATGNLVKASRRTVRTNVYNIVSAYGSDPAAPTGYQVAYNKDPNSPLRWNGPFSASPRYYASPLIRTPAQAADAAASILSRYTGLPTTLGLWTVPNPALRPLDSVAARVTGLAETHLIDEVTIPLAISGAGPVEITTKTTNDVVIPEEPDDTGGGVIGGGPTVPTQAQINQEKAFQITSTAENSTVQWWTQFGYLEDIGDGRGYTCGIAGFTSATGDLLEVVQQYASAKPTGNVLAPFLPGLQTCANTGMGGSATSTANAQLGTPFKTAWSTAATDPVFQQVQQDYRNQVYWVPAFNAAVADGLGVLGLAIYYDTSINHGPGVASSGDGSFDDIRSATSGTKPSSGGSETTWLTNFLSARSTVLTAWGDNPVDGRIAMFTALLGTANLTLTCPFTWSVYGDSYTMTVDPTPYGFVSGGGTSGGGSTSWPTPGVAHNIGSQPGQNSFNIGVGFDADATYGTVHKDFTRDQIEAGLVIPGYYELTAAGEVLMSSHPGGGKTSNNTSYARVEYRELERDGSTKMAFNPSTGRHYIKGRSAIDGSMAAAKPETVLAQYHDADDDTAMIHVHDGLVRAKIRGAYVHTLEASWNHAAKDWMLEVTGGGVVNFYWGDLTTPAYSDSTFVGATAGWYGKAGDYMQWNLSNGDATICRVKLTNLEHWHSVSPKSPGPWPQPARPATGGGSTGSGGGTGTGSTGGTSSSDDGVEAAKLLGWGSPIDGDEFDYTGPPGSKWSMYDGPGHDNNGRRVPSAFNVAGGILTCTGTSNGDTGGMAFSREQKFCRVEWRVRTYSINPSGSGHRYHPVLIYWPTSDEWPQGGEFDFYECDCDSGKYEAFLHIPGNDGSAQEYVSKACDISQWHNIAFEWSKSGIKGWLDGQQVFNFPGFKQPPGTMHPTIQLDNFFGSSGMEPARFDAQWMRIYTSPS